MEKFRNRYRIPSARYNGYDYGANGSYFITICTKNRVKYFCDIVETGHGLSPIPHHINGGDDNTRMRIIQDTGHGLSLRATEIGRIATDFWHEIPSRYPFVELDDFIIMPDHLHGIIKIRHEEPREWQPNKFGIQKNNLPSVIGSYKSSVKRYANQHAIPFEWQTRYHDRIIRDEEELDRIRKYIGENPIKYLEKMVGTKSEKR